MNGDRLAEFEKVESVKNFSFAKNTTYACGGNAEVAYFPKTLSEAQTVYDYIKDKRFVTLGNGSNVLASDSYFDGSVLSTKRLTGVELSGKDTLFCYSGTTVSALLKFCVQNGLGGLEYLAGIPATVGGLAYMNGGAGGRYISDNVDKVSFYDGHISDFSNKSCKFGHKYSIMRDIKGLILGVELKIYSKTVQNIRCEIEAYLNKRRALPKGASCGCVFKNPENVSAGKLIDEVGLKGLSCGGAFVSPEHANFIINNGGCAADTYSLINTVRQKVFEKTGILLEEEVVYIGDF